MALTVSPGAYRDQTYIPNISNVGSAFPYKTINDFTANTFRPTMPLLTNQNAIPFSEDEGVGISVALMHDKTLGPIVKPGDVVFLATKDMVTFPRVQSRYVLDPSTGGGTYPSQTYMATNTFPVSGYNHVAINKAIAKVQFDRMLEGGADMKSDAVQIEHLMSVTELLRFGRPCGVLVHENPSGTTGELDPIKRVVTSPQKSKVSIRGRAPLKNVFGVSHLGSKLSYVLKLKRVSQDTIYDVVPRSTPTAAPQTGNILPMQFGGSVAESATKGYTGNTTDHVVECYQRNASRIVPGSPYIYQWFPAVNRYGNDLRAMGISQALPVSRSFIDEDGIKHVHESREWISTGCVVSIASVISGIKDVDYGQQDVYRDYNAAPSMAMVDVNIEMMNATCEDIFELPETHIIERVTKLGQEPIF